MPVILMVIGFGWALFVGGNVVRMLSNHVSSGIEAFGLVINMVFFVLPGLLVGGLGYHMQNKRKASGDEEASVQVRIDAAVAAALEKERQKSRRES